MVGMRRGRGFVRQLRMAIDAHAIRLILELQRGVVGRPVVAVGIVAASATGVALAEALGALECLDHKGGLAEAAVFVEALAGELAEGHGSVAQEESPRARIVQFAGGTCRMHVRLQVTLRADADEVTVVEAIELDRRIERVLTVDLTRGYDRDVGRGGPVAHLAANTRFAEDKIVSVEAAAFDIPKLAGMTDGAVRLVVRIDAELLPVVRVGSSGALAVDNLPVVHPALLNGAVLNREDVNLFVRQGCGVGLLPFGADDVVDRIGMPAAIRLFDLEEMAPVAQDCAREQCAIWSRRDLKFSVAVGYAVSGIELVVSFGVADDLLWLIGLQHLRHAALVPPAIDAAANVLQAGTRHCRDAGEWRRRTGPQGTGRWCRAWPHR